MIVCCRQVFSPMLELMKPFDYSYKFICVQGRGIAKLALLLMCFLGIKPLMAEEKKVAAMGKLSVYDFTVEDIAGQPLKLSDFKGKVTLIVNTASNCGFTPQYKGLEELYQRYKDRGFTVLAFPSNDFGGQEPGSATEIKNYCESKYKVTFPLLAKGPVSGTDKQPVYKFLTEESAPDFQGDPGWNFVKFLIDQDGQVVGRYSSMTTPLSNKIIRKVEELLARS